MECSMLQRRSRSVKEWLNELKGAVYEAEDLMDEIAFEALRMEMEAGRFRSSKFPLPNLLSSLNPLKWGRKEIEKKSELILAGLEYLVKQKDALGLWEGVGEKPSAQEILTISLVDEPGVFGSCGDKEAIVELLLIVDANSDNPCVFPFVGMGGVGKITSAQLVYNDDRVKECFDIKTWVVLDDVWNEDIH